MNHWVLRMQFVIVWGDGLMRGEVQHMELQKDRIWKHIHHCRRGHVKLTQHFTAGRKNNN